MDIASAVGILLGIAAIVGGHVFEGGHVSDIMQPTAAFIVFGGTLSACLVQFSVTIVKASVVDLRKVLLHRPKDFRAMIRTIVEMSSKARREGVLAIEKELVYVEDPFMKKGLGMVADGMKVQDIKPTLELEIDQYESTAKKAGKVWEAAGGYSPTVGILGAVLGLIHVMQNLSDPSALGAGIAVAFVATVYGVGAANLWFLPFAGKINERVEEDVLGMELIVEGVCAISAGESPLVTERKLSVYAQHRQTGDSPDEAGKAADAAVDGAAQPA